MIVISMSDFLGNPKQYVEQAHHNAVLIENAGENVKLSPAKPRFLTVLLNLFSVKHRRAERDKRDVEIINANAERFNAEAEENLEFQADIWENAE